MADDATDVQSEITLEDFNADEQVAAKTDPSPVKEEKPNPPKEPVAAEEPKEEKTDEVAPPDVPTKDAKLDEAKEPEAEVVEEKPQGKAEDRKTQLNTEIRDLVAQRNALRDEVTKRNSEVYQVATEDELVDGGMTELEAKVEAMRQETAMKEYNAQVADAQLTISSESERVLRDFPIFNSDSNSYDKELAQEAAQLLESNLLIDQNSGQVIGTNGSIYQLYKTLARASGISATKGQIKGQQDTERQLANVDAVSNAAPPKEKIDPLMALWKED